MSETEGLNKIFDVADALAEAKDSNEAWLAAVRCTEQLGFNALNVVEVHKKSGAIHWFRSSMELPWLVDYVGQEFYEIDPLLVGANAGHRQMRMVDGYIENLNAETEAGRALMDQIASWQYRTLDANVFEGVQGDTFKGVTVSRGEVGEDLPFTNRVLSAVISSGVSAPGNLSSPGATPFILCDLSAREKDVLSYLAVGIRNDGIAFKLGIAEVTVRAHITSARQKLGAATREEAIAVALRSGLLVL